MPEGHIVHADAARFTSAMAGQVVRAASPQGRFADGAAVLDGRELVAARAHGKHLFLEFADGPHLHVHLGLIGTWTWSAPDSSPGPTVRLRLTGPDGAADLRGVMVCELATRSRVEQVLSALGPDPILSPRAPSSLWSQVSGSSRPIGTLLLDQAVVAGAGLIWRCEAPFLARIWPYQPGRDLTPSRWATLWRYLHTLMHTATTLNLAGDHAALTATYHVFRRHTQPCHHCHTPIAVAPLPTRNTWWCPHHQPPC